MGKSLVCDPSYASDAICDSLLYFLCVISLSAVLSSECPDVLSLLCRATPPTVNRLLCFAALRH